MQRVDRVVGVASPQFVDNTQYAFANWSDGGGATHTIRTPASAATFTANLAAVGEPPQPWRSTDVSDRTVAGTTAYANGTFTIKGGGNDIWGATDEFRYVWQPLSGDGSIVARVTGQANTNPWAKSGVMIKESTDPGAPYASLAVTPGNGMRMQWNFSHDSGGGSYAFPNAWVKLTRTGSTFTSYRSVDGQNWTPVDSTSVAMAEDATVGLFVSSHNDATLNQTTFDRVTVTESPAQPSPLPTPWERTEVGGSQPEGSASYTSTGQVYTVAGGGTDIWGDQDQSSYVHRALTGDGTIIARVKSQVSTDPWAKAGIMIKASTQGGSPYAAMMTTPGNGTRFQSQFNFDASGGAYQSGQAWLKLVRTGNTFTGYVSGDGVSWNRVSSRTIAMPSSVTAGLFVNAHAQGSALGSAAFDRVSVTPTDTSLPTGWAAADIGDASPGGSTTAAGGTFTVSGGGRDIWGTVDEGHFAWQKLDGDGTVVARLSGLEATNDWAKAGLMIKQSATAGDPYGAVLVTKNHGVHLQSQFNRDIAGGASVAPRWLKLTRTGTQLAAYESANGTDWTLVGRTTVAMTTSVAAGLVVSGHDGGASVATATFTDVSVTASGGGALPQPWASSDVGPVQVAGSGSYTNGVFTVRGAGNDIWGDTDEMHFVHQPISGDGIVIARVSAQENTDAWAKSGIMIKASTSPQSDYVALAVTPGHGVRLQSGFNRDIAGGSVALPAGWLKLQRVGSTIIGFRSADGQTWTEVGRLTTTIPSSARMGLFVNSHDGSALNSSTFTDVQATP